MSTTTATETSRATRASQTDRGSLPAAIGAGLLSGLNALLRALAMAALVFAGPLEPFLATGIALAVASAIILSAVVAAASSYRGSIATVSDSNGILALVAVSVVAGAGAGAGGAANASASAATMLAAIAISTLAIGAALLALGALRLGRLVRYIPYPVIGGFQAGIGWLLVQGAFSVSLGQSVHELDLDALLGYEALARWAPAAGVAVLLLRPRTSPALAIPAALLACVLVFWLGAGHLGLTAGSLAADGWLLGPFPAGGLWQHLVATTAMESVHWSLLVAELPKLGVMVLIALVGVLLTGTSLELLVERDVDLDRELRAAGIANLLAGLAGGMHGYQSLSGSTLSHRLAGPRRTTGIVCAAFCLISMSLGPTLLELVPKVVPAVLLFYIGLDLLWGWLYRARQRLGGPDHAVVVAVLATVALVGFVEGVIVGMLAAVILFAVSASRVNVVKQAFTGAQRQSTALRSDYPREVLREAGRAIFVLRLSGYLFFGTAYRMVHELHARLADTEEVPLRFLLLDLKLVTGMDASAVISVRKLAQYAREHGFEIALTDTPQAVRGLLERGGVARERRERAGYARRGPERRGAGPTETEGTGHASTLHLRMFADLDHGLEWCETTLLNELDKGGTRRITSLRERLARGLGDPARVDRFLECADLQRYGAGEELIRQGSSSTYLLLIRSGRVSVRLETPGERAVRLRRLGAGAVIGDVAFYLGGRRSASVVADEETSAYRITRSAMGAMEEIEPELCMLFHRMMATMLCERVIDTDTTIAALVD